MKTKAKILYHGTSSKLIGKELIPKEATDLGENIENTKRAVYATDRKELAISMGIICSKGVHGSSLSFNNPKKEPPYGIIYSGKPESDIFYVHHLNSKDFKKSKGFEHQYFSTKNVKPLKTEILNVKDYLNHVRDATPEESTEYTKKFNLKYKDNKIISKKK